MLVSSEYSAAYALDIIHVGNVKQVVTIFVSASIFDVTIGALNAFGISLTLLGGFLYSQLSLRQVIPSMDGSDYRKVDPVGITRTLLYF